MSSDLQEIVDLTITADAVGAAVANFGIGMLLSCNAPFPERARVYTSASGVQGDGFASTSPEVLAATLYFAQKPAPKSLIIGRAVGKPTMAYRIDVTTVANAHTYTLKVKGEGVTATTCTYLSDGSATNDEIIGGLVTALQAVVGKNYTAASAGSGGSLYLTITGSAPGNWFSIENVEVAYLKSKMTHSEPATTIATDITNICLVNDDWYGLITLYNSSAYVQAAALAIEPLFKIYVPDVADSESVTLAVTGGDTLDALHTSGYARTAGAYHPAPAAMFAAAWMGKMFPLTPGRATWALKTLAAVAYTALTPTQRTNLEAKSASWYRRIGGVSKTWEGHSSDGEYINTQIGLDWQYNDMQVAVFNYIAGQPEGLPFTIAGQNGLHGVIDASLARGVSRGFLAENLDPDNLSPSVFVPSPDDVSDADKAERDYTGITFSAKFANSVHKVGIAGHIGL